MARLACFIVLFAPVLTGCAGEWSNGLCHRGWTVAHPTMTTAGISIGADARVRQVSEGAKGNLGAGYATELDLE
jgi:hypothetical protein